MFRDLIGNWTMPKSAREVKDANGNSDYWIPVHKFIDGTVYNWQQIEQDRLGIWREIDCWTTGFGELNVEIG